MHKYLPQTDDSFIDYSYLTEVQKAYWAGILDGEGHISVTKYNNLPVVALSMTCEKTVKAFQETFELGSVLKRSRNSMKDHWKDTYTIKASCHKASRICEELLPYFITKRDVAEEVSKFYIHECEFCKEKFWSTRSKKTCSEDCTRNRKMLYAREYREKNKGAFAP